MVYKNIHYEQTEYKEFEDTITFMIDAIRDRCRNEKPLIFHSLTVGMKLYELGVAKETVIGGFLHDLIEDTNCSIDVIKEKFGKKVADIVLACTADDSIKDYRKRWYKFIKQIVAGGEEAMILKVVDAHQNLPYVTLIDNKEKLKEVLWKHNLVVDTLRKYVGDQKVFKDYEKELREIEGRAQKNINLNPLP